LPAAASLPANILTDLAAEAGTASPSPQPHCGPIALTGTTLSNGAAQPAASPCLPRPGCFDLNNTRLDTDSAPGVFEAILEKNYALKAMLLDLRIRNLTSRSLPMIRITTGLLAIILLALTLQDAFEVMLLPRAVQRQVRLVRYYYRASWAAWRAIARRLPAGHKREHFLAIYGALSMVTLFAAWASSLIVGFGMLFWALRAETQTTLADHLYMSGVTFFTLGYSDMVPHSGFSRLLAVIEGGTGFGFIAVVIGYLPVLYQLFSRREAHVILLDARAGTPPTALGLFWRHPGKDGAVQINTLLTPASLFKIA